MEIVLPNYLTRPWKKHLFRFTCNNTEKERKTKTMSTDNANLVDSPADGSAVNENDVNMKCVDSNGAKTIRNVQTQHGDYRSVDDGNVFLIARCLWPEDYDGCTLKPKPPATSMEAIEPIASTSNENAELDENAEQVVWIEPFADEVSSFKKQN